MFVSGSGVTTLSIFVDESGDFGRSSSGYYVVTLIFHEQHEALGPDLVVLDRRLAEIGLVGHGVHSGAALRGEAEYRHLPFATRKAAFNRMFAFVRKAPLRYQAFTFRRRQHVERLDLEAAISRELGAFLQGRTEYFRAFGEVIVYYDNGQAELTRILNAVMNAYFLQVEFRRVSPPDYRLFQAADLCCTLELLRLKDEDRALTRTDAYFFESERKLRKDYLKQLEAKRLR